MQLVGLCGFSLLPIRQAPGCSLCLRCGCSAAEAGQRPPRRLTLSRVWLPRGRHRGWRTHP